jgi:hypothetical protein
VEKIALRSSRLLKQTLRALATRQRGHRFFCETLDSFPKHDHPQMEMIGAQRSGSVLSKLGEFECRILR